MNVNQQSDAGKELHAADRPRGKWVPWLVLIFALIYYASYYRNGLNLAGEGGTAGVLALRLLEGQRPIIDTFLGYNVLWFYPIAGLFKLFGPNYLILKIYFFSLCTITAILGTLLVRRITRSPMLALSTGVLLVLIPGTQFRTYLPFLGVLNMVVLLHTFVFPYKSFWKREVWMAITGLVLGLTYLIRIDVGLLITPLILVLLLVFPCSTELGFGRGLVRAMVGALTIALFGLLTHLPVLWDAHRRGFQEQFLGQYQRWFCYIQGQANEICPKNLPEPSLPSVAHTTQQPQPAAHLSSSTSTTSSEANENATLKRPPISNVLIRKSVRRMFAWLVYFPVPIIFLILVGMGLVWLVSVFQRNFENCQRSLGVLVALGCAVTLFPQYFFFRPDTPHISEFMVPFVVTMVLACFQAVQFANKKGKLSVLAWTYAIVLLLFCIPDVVADVSNGLRRESAGSIAAIKQRGREFVASNGVRVFVQPEDFSELQGMYSTIVNNSKPTDWVVCYPYLPTVNFMTNRRTYEYNLYVDNATKGRDFDFMTINKLLHFQPAIVVISLGALNHNEASYFKNWAAPTYQFIKSHYRFAGTYQNTEIYLRKQNP